MAGWYKPSLNSTYFRFMTVYGIGFPHYNLQKIQQTLDEKSRSSSCKPLGCHDPSSLVVLGGCSSRFRTGTSYSNVHTTKDGFTRKDLRYKLGCATSSDRIIGCIEKGLRVWFSFFFSSILHRERFPCDLSTSQSSAPHQWHLPSLVVRYLSHDAFPEGQVFRYVGRRKTLYVRRRLKITAGPEGVQHLYTRVLFINNFSHESLVLKDHIIPYRHIHRCLEFGFSITFDAGRE